MLAKEYSWIPFHIVACNSQENGTDIQLLSNQKNPTNKSWESSRNGAFPIEIIIRFHYRSELNHILVSTKLDKNIPDIEFYIGDGLSGSFVDAEYRLAGNYKYPLNNKQTQIPLQGIGNFLKIKMNTKPIKSPSNPFSQVSFSTLRLWGRYTSYITKIKDNQIPLESENTDNVDKILIGLGIPMDLLNWHEQDVRQWEAAPIDSQTKITVSDLQKLKQQALVQQDYEMLKALTQDIKKVFDIGLEIHKLERELKFAIAKEDFTRAMALKKRLLDLRNRRDGFDALYETSRYENMVGELRPNTAEYNNMVRLMDEEAENDRLRNVPRQQTPLMEQEDFNKSRHSFVEQDKGEDDDRKIKGGEDGEVPWWEKTGGQDMKFKTKKKRQKSEEKTDQIKSQFKNPFAFNEGDVDLELYLKPLMTNIGEKVEDIPAEILRRLYTQGYLTVFGAKVWSAVHSENWRHREAAAQAVLNFIEMPLPDKYLNGKSRTLFLACMELAKIACDDKILSIYFIGLKILSTALSPPVCGTDVSPKVINQAIKEFIPLLVDRISELNFRARDITMHTLLSIFKHPVVQIGELIRQCLKSCIEDPNFSSLYVPPDKQPERVIKARLEVILSIVQDQGIDERQWQWTDAFIYLCVPSLFHPSNEVRMLSIELIVAMYLVIGEDVRSTVLDVDMKPNLFEIIVMRMDEVREQAIENQKLREDRRGQILQEEEERQARKQQQQQQNKSQVGNNSMMKQNRSVKKSQYKPGDYSQFKEEVDNLQANIEEKGIAVSLDCVVKSQKADKPMGAIISVNPPATFYFNNAIAPDGSVKLNCNLDYTSSKDYPHFLNTFCEFLNVSPQGSLIIELKFIDNLEKKVIKDYGWTVMPLYQETGQLYSGEIQLPLYKPPINLEIIQALTSQPDQIAYMQKMAPKFIEWSSVVLRIEELKNKQNRQYIVSNLDKVFLPPKKVDKFTYTQKMFDQAQVDRTKKPLSKIIPSKKTEEEFQTAVETVFNEGLKLIPAKKSDS